MIPLFPDKDYVGINGCTEEQLLHPHFKMWQKWLSWEYEHPKNKIAVFLPGATIKPYYNSPIHRLINKELEPYEIDIHKVVISNPGVVPYEFANMYPFNAYDWNPAMENAFIQRTYATVTENRIFDYLGKHDYGGYISYLRPDSISFWSLKRACEYRGLDLISSMLYGMIPEDKDRDLVLIRKGNLEVLTSMVDELL